MYYIKDERGNEKKILRYPRKGYQSGQTIQSFNCFFCFFMIFFLN